MLYNNYLLAISKLWKLDVNNNVFCFIFKSFSRILEIAFATMTSKIVVKSRYTLRALILLFATTCERFSKFSSNATSNKLSSRTIDWRSKTHAILSKCLSRFLLKRKEKFELNWTILWCVVFINISNLELSTHVNLVSLKKFLSIIKIISFLTSTILCRSFNSRDSFNEETFNESKREIEKILIFVNLFVISTI